jgi:hypothetical protein
MSNTTRRLLRLGSPTWHKLGRREGKLLQSISSASEGLKLMLFDPDYRKGGGQIGILGSGKADEGYGLPIGVHFFGAFGSEANII